MPVGIKSSGGGTTTLVAASSATNYTATLPANSGVLIAASTTIGAANTRLVSDGTTASWQGTWFKPVVFSINMSTASGTQSITGVGFKPKAGTFISAVNGSNIQSQGFDDGSTAISVISVIQGGYPTYYNETGNSMHYDPTGADTNTYRGRITSWDNDGFTVTWTKVGSPTGTLIINALLYR